MNDCRKDAATRICFRAAEPPDRDARNNLQPYGCAFFWKKNTRFFDKIRCANNLDKKDISQVILSVMVTI